MPNPVTGAGESRRLDAFVVSYSDEDPARAQRIANRLARVFVDEHSKSRAERAEDTSAFIGTQLRASQARLADLEARAAEGQGIVHGPAPRADAGEPADAGRPPAAARIERHCIPGRAGSPVDDRAQISALKQGTHRPALLPRGQRVPRNRRKTASSRCSANWPRPRRSTRTSIRKSSGFATSWPPRGGKRRQRARARRRSGVAARSRSHLPSADGRSRNGAHAAARRSSAASDDTQRQITESTRRGWKRRRWSSSSSPRVQREFDLERQQYAELSDEAARPRRFPKMSSAIRSGEQFTVLYPAWYPDCSPPSPCRGASC